MAILVKMPLETYQGFMGSLPLSSGGYAVLKNSIIEATDEGDSAIVDILCGMM